MKTQSILPWYGSENGVAKDIAALLDRCQHVTIPFAGGLGILPHLKARAIIANDKQHNAIHFYRTLKDAKTRSALMERCKSTLCHPRELEIANGFHNQGSEAVMAAWSYWARCWLGRKGKGGCPDVGSSASIRWSAGGGTNATRIAAAAGDLDAWAELFHRVEFLCEDFRDVLAKVKDRPDCGVYVDAPWIGVGDKYEHKFTDQDHRDLASDLRRFEYTRVVIRYGGTPLISKLYSEDEWIWMPAESRTQANVMRGEVWIINHR